MLAVLLVLLKQIYVIRSKLNNALLKLLVNSCGQRPVGLCLTDNNVANNNMFFTPLRYSYILGALTV